MFAMSCCKGWTLDRIRAYIAGRRPVTYGSDTFANALTAFEFEANRARGVVSSASRETRSAAKTRRFNDMGQATAAAAGSGIARDAGVGGSGAARKRKRADDQ